LERLGRRAHDLGELLGDLLADDGFGLLLERLGALADRLSLGEALGLDRRALGGALGLGRLGLGQAGLLHALGLGGRRQLDAPGVGLGLQLGLALACLGQCDARGGVAFGLDPLAVGLGVGRLA